MWNYSPLVHKQVSRAKQAGKQLSEEEMEVMELLSQASDTSYSGSRVPHQHDVNQKGNELYNVSGNKIFVPQFTFMAGSNLHHLSRKSITRHIHEYFLNCRAHR